MCKYCEHGIPLMEYTNFHLGAQAYMDIFAGEIRLMLDVEEESSGRISIEGIEIEKNIPIEFCPMCGSKLGL